MPSPDSMSGASPDISGYRIHRRIGAGGYGEIWLAESDTFGWCALKIVRRTAFEDDRPFDRERRGLRNYQSLTQHHRTLIRVLEAGDDPEGRWFWYAMELADGWPGGRGGEPARYEPESLRSRLRRSGPMPPRECLEMILPLLEALELLHARDLVHRDVKPSNVLLVGGQPKLSDPGLVASLEEPRSLAGTREYVPTEGAGTPGGDLFALGKTLYELATGRPPQDVAELPTRLSVVPERSLFLELVEIVGRACDPRPQGRYPSAGAMRDDVQHVLSGESVRQIRRARERVVRFQRWALAATGVAAVLGGVMVWELRQAHRIRSAEASTRRQYVHSLENNGLRALDSGELPLAGLWFLEGMKLAETPAAEERARIRIGTVLRMTPKILHLEAHSSPVNEALFSPDGRWVFAGYEDGTARIWDAHSFQPVAPNLKHDRAIRSATFSPDGTRLVTGGEDGRARVWEVPGGRLVHTLGDGKTLEVVRFSPDGLRIATGDEGGWVQLWRAGDGQPEFVAKGHTERIRALEFSPDGRRLATAGSDGAVEIRDAVTGQSVGSRLFGYARSSTIRPPHFSPGNHQLRCLAFSRDGRLLAFGGSDSRVSVWNVTGEPFPKLEIPFQDTYWIGFSDDGELLVTAGGGVHSGGEVRVWSTADGRPIGTARRHEHLVRHASISHRGWWFLTASHDHTSRLWDLRPFDSAARSPAMPHGDRVWRAVFDPATPTRWLTAGRDGCWRIWHWEFPGNGGSSTYRSGDLGRVFLSEDRATFAMEYPTNLLIVDAMETTLTNRLEVPAPSGVRCLTFSSDGRSLAFADTNGGVAIKNARTGQTTAERVFPPDSVIGCRFSPDGRKLLVWGGTNATIWQVAGMSEGNESFLSFRAVTAYPIQEVAFSPDGRFLLIGTGNRNAASMGTFEVWSLESGVPVAHETLPMTVVRIAYNPDGRSIALATADDTSRPGEVRLRDAVTWRPMGNPMPHGDGVSCLVFDPGGKVLITGGEDGHLLKWDANTGRYLGPLGTRLGGISNLAISSNGRFLAASFRYCHMQIWDMEVLQPIMPEAWEIGQLTGLRFLPNSSHLLTTCTGGDSRLWSLDPITNGIPELEQELSRLAGHRIIDGVLKPLGAAELR